MLRLPVRENKGSEGREGRGAYNGMIQFGVIRVSTWEHGVRRVFYSAMKRYLEFMGFSIYLL